MRIIVSRGLCWGLSVYGNYEALASCKDQAVYVSIYLSSYIGSYRGTYACARCLRRSVRICVYARIYIDACIIYMCVCLVSRWYIHLCMCVCVYL